MCKAGLKACATVSLFAFCLFRFVRRYPAALRAGDRLAQRGERLIAAREQAVGVTCQREGVAQA